MHFRYEGTDVLVCLRAGPVPVRQEQNPSGGDFTVMPVQKDREISNFESRQQADDSEMKRGLHLSDMAG